MASGRSALIVATSRYADVRLATLDGPARDAEALKGVLGAPDIGGFEVRTVINGRAARIRETLEAFLLDRSRDDLLLIHFSGHGLKDDDGQLYLAATDTKLDRLMSTGIDAGWVNRLMDRCRSERIGLFLDCCFAGAFTSAMTRRAGGDTAGVRDHFAGRGLVVITASDAMQYSFEGGRQVGEPPAPSPFSQALVDGLRTGEADRNEDGQVSINELFDYLEERVRATSPAQTPTKSAVNQTGDWVIARSTRVPSVRLLPERVQLLLKSDQTIDRLEAIIELQRVRSSPDARTAQAAMAALQGLAADDSRRVAQRAAEALGDEPSALPIGGSPVGETAVVTPASPVPRPAPAEPVPVVIEAVAMPTQGAASDRPVADSYPADMARGVARGLLGSVIGVVAAVSIAQHLPDPLSINGSQEAAVAVGSTVAAVVIEFARLRLRVMREPQWTTLAGNRWTEAAGVGVLVSLIAVLIAAVIGVSPNVPLALLILMITQAVGFLVAEAAVGMFRPHAAPGSAAR